MTRFKRNFICYGVFFFLLGIGIFFTHQTEDIKRKEQVALIQEFAVAQARAIERRLISSLSATYFLALELDHLGSPERFAYYAHNIIDSIGGISNLQLAPGGVVSMIYPLEGNEAALGHNILKDDKRRKDAIDAIRDKALTLAGPFNLVQGGTAVIGRNPVFIKNNGVDEFWGFVSALIYLDDLIKATDLKALEQKGFRYQLSHFDPDKGQNDVFVKSVQPLDDIVASTNINVPNNVWRLFLSQKEPNGLMVYVIGYAVTLLVALFAVFSLRYILLEPERLKLIIRLKTRELEKLAFYDPLTQLANRRLFLEKVSIACLNSDKSRCALMYLDLDRFKEINDRLGHDAGDVLLLVIAARLTSIVEGKGLVARLGGDEFAILLSDYRDRKAVKLLAQELLKSINEPVVLQGKNYSVSASIGVTLIPEDGDSSEEVLGHADMAMYKAKELGRNNAYFFKERLKKKEFKQDCMDGLKNIEDELSLAIENQELMLCYQPLINMREGDVVACEAMICWHHPEKGVLHHSVFWPLAQESEKMVDVGYWVFEQACLTIQSQLEEASVALPVCVNLAYKHFIKPDFIDVITSILKASNVPAHYLILELDESIVINGSKSEIAKLATLREMGVSISIDGFNTGYSFLSTLTNLPVDTIKIAPQSIRHLEVSREQQSLVHDIISLAHIMGVNVVVEGIERDKQAALLKQYGCDIGQGYLYSKPMEKNMLAFYLSSKKSETELSDLLKKAALQPKYSEN
ncbi:Phytochrome-like protein cph2 [Marinomonas spartinae]|uniref:Phytochrome-like protein cph2 n=1 Tax=Marinomonas spartinae TaxID=1792290 RepID=A0A1A8T857_9GAMM|nr:EAL domain-containing protein [Marinomonas spartinae]SBS27922.1 Phytochrome-like protein cph2 [Marinomonas spartinae]SBS28521.1 Phytochrome-like protein cph2 [Marinomonas spartinae]